MAKSKSYPKGYVGFWKRFLAYSVDTLIIGIISGAVGGGTSFSSIMSRQHTLSPQVNGIALLVGIVYFVFFWISQNGQTLGNKLLAIRVVKENGMPLDLGSAIIRYLGYIISGFVLCLGFLWVAWDSKKQGWHDKMAGTIVVNTGGKSHTLLAILIVFLTFILGIILVVIIVVATALGVLKGSNLSQTSTSQYTQAQADAFALKIFTLINQKRAADNLAPLNENQDLCIYDQKLLSEAASVKNFPFGQHFLEDTANPQLQAAYFSQFTQEFIEYTPTLPVDQAIPAANDWYTKKGLAINYAAITDGCIRSDPNNTIFIYAKATSNP